jgi:hypothetical protein
MHCQQISASDDFNGDSLCPHRYTVNRHLHPIISMEIHLALTDTVKRQISASDHSNENILGPLRCTVKRQRSASDNSNEEKKQSVLTDTLSKDRDLPSIIPMEIHG